MHPSRGTICVFAKPPRPGEVKTRLAHAVGEGAAAAFARAFLEDTCALVTRWPRAHAVLATTEAETREGLDVWLQGDGDLGERLERVMRRALGSSDWVIAIGADTPGLPRQLLERAASALDRFAAVLGPSDDGGFYLIGLTRCPHGLLADIPWSSSDTFRATRTALESAGLPLAILEPWFDVDRFEDLERIRSAIARGDIDAPATKRALAELL